MAAPDAHKPAHMLSVPGSPLQLRPRASPTHFGVSAAILAAERCLPKIIFEGIAQPHPLLTMV